MIFRKSKGGRTPIPIERIQEMSYTGMSDKDIIKRLKKEGYTYEEIERAMLQAVKAGVGEGPVKPQPQYGGVPETYASEPSTLEDVYGREKIEGAPEMSMGVPELGESLSTEPEVPDSEVILEELVEGVVEEKWQKITERLERFEEKVDSMESVAKHLEGKIATGSKEFPAQELEGKVSDQNSRLEDLEARVGGLEKAFRQFLPSLTRNIENLSNIIHEMKEKTGSS